MTRPPDDREGESGPTESPPETSDPERDAGDRSGDRPPQDAEGENADRDADDEGEEWRFGLDEVGEDAAEARPPLEPGSPSLENALFVLLGAVGTLFVLVAMV
ncbi:DUF7312 domain-containing protein [Halegenticoccus soli]|uniref:DUF7312 domain-containing protein n=1 Tax=Halegenticoccus soli TaxID=1985678 RepID=UPI000C6EE8CE|nr:hypothetical protein [Halegenticoccus soli]